MKKIFVRLLSICLLAVLVLTMLTACSDKKKFVGTWVDSDSDYELVLANDGSGSIKEDGLSGSVRWSVEKNKLYLTVSICGMAETNEYSYRFSGNKMILTDVDGEISTFVKK